MLCLQDCIDMCDVTPEEESALWQTVTLAEISEALTLSSQQGDGSFFGIEPHEPHDNFMLFDIYPDVYRGSPVLHSVRR
ncbi:MAG: hypothetical protein ACM3SV_10365 [Betaproteobacteria bacterium]